MAWGAAGSAPTPLFSLLSSPSPHQGVFEGFLDEALTLHRTHDFLPGFPLAPTVLGAKALLAYRRGAVEATLDLARGSLEAAHADPLSRMCYPCVYAVSRLIPVAREAVCENHTRVINTPELVAKAVALGRAGGSLWGPPHWVHSALGALLRSLSPA